MSQCLFDGRLTGIYQMHVIQEDCQKIKWEIRDSAPKQTKLHRAAALIFWSQSLQVTMTLMNEALRIASLPRTLTLHPPSCSLLRDPCSRNCWFSLVNVYLYLKCQAWGPELRKDCAIQLSQGLYAHYSTLTMSIVMALSQGFSPQSGSRDSCFPYDPHNPLHSTVGTISQLEALVELPPLLGRLFMSFSSFNSPL